MEHLDERIERAVGSAPVHYAPRPGGYSTAERYAVELADGRSVFVKSSPAPNLAEWIRRIVGLPPPGTAPHVRPLQRRQLAVALDWIDRDLL